MIDASVIDAPRAFDASAIDWPDGCFTIRDLDGKTYESDEKRCAEQRRPFSTFKVPNALIGVELGILDGADASMTWDKKKVPDEPWYKDSMRTPHTLKSAMAVSAVPYFRTLALLIGAQRMREMLDKLDYGNRDVSGRLDRAWLPGGKLAISARAQLVFVDALARGALPVSKRAQEVVAEVIVLERSGDRVMYGKTGSGPIEHGKGGSLVWRVGWVKTPDGHIPYAAWLESQAKTTDEARAVRDERLKAMFAKLGVFPAP